jgi:putative transcriptional regulator
MPLPQIDTLRRFLSSRRSELGYTYDQLAVISGVSRRTLVSIETGGSPGSMETWFRLSTALNVGFDELFTVVTGRATTMKPALSTHIPVAVLPIVVASIVEPIVEPTGTPIVVPQLAVPPIASVVPLRPHVVAEEKPLPFSA